MSIHHPIRMYLQEQAQTDPLMSQRGFPLFPTAMPHNLRTYNLPHAASIASLFLPRPPKKLPVLMISASFDIWKTLPLDLVEPKIAERHIIWITICKANVQRQSLSRLKKKDVDKGYVKDYM